MAIQGRCMKCQEQKDMKSPAINQTKKGGFMAKGSCPDCGTTLCKIMSKDKAEKAVSDGEAEKNY